MDAWHWALVGIGAVALIVAVLAAVLAFRGQGKLAKMKSTNTITAAEAAAAAMPGGGVTVELYGNAEVAEPLIAPGTGTHAVYYRHKVEQLYEEYQTRSYGDHGGGYPTTTHEWRTVSDERQYLPFLLRDSSGAIQVNPQDAEIVARETLSNSPAGFQGKADSHGVLDMAKNLGLGALSTQTGQRRQSEWVVAAGTPVYVLGDAVTTPEGPVVRKGADPFIVSWKSEKELSKTFSWKTSGWLVGAFVAIALGALGIFYGFTNKTWFRTEKSPIVLILAGVVVVAGLAFEMFNFMPYGRGRMHMGIPGGDPYAAQLWGAQGAPIQPDMVPSLQSGGPAPDGFTTCPSCRTPIPQGVAKCPHCHWNLGPGDAAPAGALYAAPAQSPMAGGAEAALGMAGLGGVAAAGLIGTAMSNPEVDRMLDVKDKITCPNCNLELAPTIKKCPGCGTDLTRSVPTTPAAAAELAQPGASSVPAAPAEGDAQAPPAQAGSAAVPAAPVEGAPQTAAAPPGPQVPAAPADHDVKLGVVQRDVVIGGVVAFKQGERVQVEAESPDPQRPEYRFVVLSRTLNKKFRLSDLDLFV